MALPELPPEACVPAAPAAALALAGPAAAPRARAPAGAPATAAAAGGLRGRRLSPVLWARGRPPLIAEPAPQPLPPLPALPSPFNHWRPPCLETPGHCALPPPLRAAPAVLLLPVASLLKTRTSPPRGGVRAGEVGSPALDPGTVPLAAFPSGRFKAWVGARPREQGEACPEQLRLEKERSGLVNSCEDWSHFFHFFPTALQEASGLVI